MGQKDHDLLQTKDEIFNAFRPIEQLFKIMDMELTRFRGQIILCEGEFHDVETPPVSPGIP